MLIKKISLSLVALCLLSFQQNSYAEQITDKVDHIFSQWDSKTSPGFALAIIKDNKIIYERGYGLANLDYDIPITPETVFDIGSTSKQFTAACIAILATQNKLALDADIRKYIPEFPIYEKPITINHLLHHTSGIRDYLSLESLAGKGKDDYYTSQDLLQLLQQQKELNFTPGEKHMYSNSGYFLLGLIVERVSGRTLNDFATQNLFKPIGMKNTHFHNDHTVVVKNRATGYSPTKDNYIIDMSNLDIVGDGGIYSTVEDLYLWDQSFYNNKLDKEVVKILTTQGQLNNQQILDYASGLVIGNYKGLKTISHGGAWAGFRAELMRFPDQKFSVILLSNLSNTSPTNLAYKVSEIYLSSKFSVLRTSKFDNQTTEIKLTDAELKSRVGSIYYQKSDLFANLSIENNNLILSIQGSDIILKPVSKNKFKMIGIPDGNYVEFNNSGVEIISPDQSIPFTYYQPLQLDNSQLSQYEGDYYSSELGVNYQFKVIDNKLTLKFKGETILVPEVTQKDKFTQSGVNVYFTRNTDNTINSFKLSLPRVKNIEFIKK